MENQVVTHITQNGRYRIVIERAATKGIDGFKIEANGDEIDSVKTDIENLYIYAQNIAKKEEVK